jgi:hypothetical protein
MGDAHLRGAEATAWLARLQPEQDNLRAALQWALDGSRYEDAAWLMLAVAWFWYHIGRWHEAVRWIAQLLPHREALEADVRLAILIDLYRVSRAPEEEQLSSRYTDELMGLLKVCPDKAMQAAAWNQIGLHSAGRVEASAAWERAIAFARAGREEAGLGPEFGVLTDRDFELACPLFTYAYNLIEHGEFERAAPLLAESAQVFQARGNSFEMAQNLGAAGRLALLRGDMERAHSLLYQAVTLAGALNYQWVLGEFQIILGLVTLYRGDAPEARRLLADSLRLSLELNDEWFLARVCTYLGEMALWEGELDAAEQWLARSLAHRTDQRLSMIDQFDRVMIAARLAAARGAYLRAATLFGSADGIRSRISYELAGPARRLADAALARVRGALDPALFAEAFTAGQQLSLEEALATIFPG